MSDTPDQTPTRQGKISRLRLFLIATTTLLALSLIVTLVTSYFSHPRVVSISNTLELDARGGEIKITYSQPINVRKFKASVTDIEYLQENAVASKVKYTSKFNKERTVETLRLLKPTPYNQIMNITRKNIESNIFIEHFGVRLIPEAIRFSTGIESIAIESTIPAQNSLPTPETLDNQLVINFKGEVRGKFKTGINIPPEEIADIVKLTPSVRGYYQWSNDSILTFNFSEDKPQFETRYHFEVFPDKLINKDYQKWVGQSTTADIITSTNEVYIVDVSAGEDVSWSEKLRIEFSGNMVGALDVLKPKDPSVVPIQMTPKVTGLWRWVNARTIEFSPNREQGWPTRQQVNVQVSSRINQDAERKWRVPQPLADVSFYVKPREQSISAYSLHGETVDLEKELTVSFSRKIIPQNVVGTRFSNTTTNQISPLHFKPAIRGDFLWVARNKLQFTPENLWSELQEYEVELNPEYNPDTRYEWSGTQKFQFKTVENLVKANFYFTPENQLPPADFFSNKDAYSKPKVGVSTEKRLWIDFSKELARQLPSGFDVSKAVEIQPKTPGQFKWLGASLLEFVPEDNWLENSQYRITLTKALLQHPQAHYPNNEDHIEFNTLSNQVSYQLKGLSKVSDKEYGVDPDQSVAFSFNKNLNTLAKVGKIYSSDNVKENELPFTLSPAAAFSYTWKTARELSITPVGYWQPSQKYTLVLKDSLLPQTQAKFQKPAKIALTTGKNIVSIEHLSPQGQTSLSPVLEVRFNKNIKPRDVNLKAADKDNMFTIEPAISGQWIWQAENELQFVPDASLVESTQYTLSFNPARISDPQFTWHTQSGKNKTPLINEKYQFHTKALHVKNSEARFEFDENNLLKQRFFLDVELSTEVTEEDLRRHFTIWYEKSVDKKTVKVPLTYKVQARSENTRHGISSFSMVSDWIDRPADDRRIHYQVTKGIKPIVGNLDMAQDYVSNFLQEKPKYINIQYVQWAWKDGQYTAKLTLNAPLEPEKLKPFLTINHAKGSALAYDLTVASNHRGSNTFSYDVTAEFKPGLYYNFAINEGLLAADGAFTNNPINYQRETPNLQRKLDFALDGQILSRKDLAKVPVLTTNLSNFNLKVHKIYENNVDYFLNNKDNAHRINDVAETIHDKKYSTTALHGEYNNRELKTHVDLSSIFNENKFGLFQLEISRDTYYDRKYRWFLSTDIGLTGRQFGNHVLVWANSLKNLAAKANAKIEVVDRWNQVVASGYTNGQGLVDIELPKGTEARIIRAELGDDFSFLHVNKHKQHFTGYDTSGISALKTHLRSYIYSDRGVYRPGDTIHLVSVTRGRDGELPIKQPVKFVITGPTGQERVAERFQLQSDGTYVYDFHVPAEAKTGKWSAKLFWDNKNIGDYQFQVEEFIPNKIKVELETLSENVMPGKQLEFKVQANNLFGPPASGRKVSAQVSLRPAYFKPKGMGRFSFGHDDVQFQRIDSDLLETRLDEDGGYTYTYRIPEGIDSPIGLEAHYNATVIDDGGRGVSNYGKLNVQVFDQYIGLRRLNTNAVEVGDKVGFELVNVDANAKLIEKSQQKVAVKIYRNKKVTHYRKNERGYYRYVTEKQRNLISELQDPRDAEGKFSFLTKASGEYIVEATDKVGGQVTRFYFRVRGPVDATSVVAAADKVDLKVLNKSQNIGDTLKLEIRTPFKGKLLLTGERDKVIFKRVINMDSLRKVIELPLNKQYFPNFYMSATVIKPVSQGGRKDPIYATGLLNVKVKDPTQSPLLTLTAPDQANPNGKLPVHIKVANATAKQMYVTLAAVDVGILNLTKFKTPSMSGYFNDKRKLEVNHLNMYPFVMPYEPDVKVNIDPSGDAPSRALVKKTRVNPKAQKRVKSVALWSGLLEFDKNGEVKTELAIPDFDGTLRLMAVAFGDQRFRSAEQEVLVRDKLVAKPTLPRFLATGDDFSLPIKLFNGTNKSGEVSITLKASEHVKLRGPATQKVQLNVNGEANGLFSLLVNHQQGLARFELIVEGVGEVTRKIINVPVRTPGTYLLEANAGSVTSSTPTTLAWPKNFIPGSEELSLEISNNPLDRYRNSIDYLLKYPHGCLEQTTSKLLPLIYFSDLAKGMDKYFGEKQSPRYFLKEGIEKLERMQLEDGHFSYWEGSAGINQWAFVYAAHFLVEAKKSGLEVNQAVWNNMIYRLNQNVKNSFNGDQLNSRHYGISHQLYGLYVLALANENVLSQVNFVHDNFRYKLKPHEIARLAATFNLLGQSSKAQNLMGEIKSFGEYDDPYRDTGGSFSSGTRDLAILLDALITIDPNSVQVPVLLEKLAGQAENGRWGTTQDNAYAFLALGKALKEGAKTLTGTVNVTLGDGRKVPFGSRLEFSTPELLAGDVSIDIEGNGEVQYSWQASGISNNPKIAQQDERMKVRRRYLDKNGDPVDLMNLHQGQLVVAEIRIQSEDGKVDNIAIEDLLPGGLEIENARLSTSASLPWIQSTVKTDYVDIRDDRISLFLSVDETELVYFYTTRAVTVGNFKVPSIRAEAMYDPSRFSVASDSQIKILPEQDINLAQAALAP